MRNSKSKTRIADVVDEIIKLRESIKKDTERLKLLESITVPEASPEPTEFDYKEAIMELFQAKPNSVETTDSIIDYIRSKYSFEPNREVVVVRIGYLADTAKKLERAKRGYYRLRTKIESPKTQVEGVG